jgi:glycosyltransferase involved in cell wall biosynthesis
LKIGILGDQDSGKRLAKHLSDAEVTAEFVSSGLRGNLTVLFRLRNYDIIHGIYMRRFVFLSLILSKLFGRITICHWEGSDVMSVGREERSRLMALILKKFVDLNLVFSENLQKELQNMGIPSVVWPIPVDSDYFVIDELPPMPKKFAVLCKLADDRLYGSDILFKLAKDFPSVTFLIVPGEHVEPSWLLSRIESVPNLVYLGWRNDMLDVYKQSTVLLRLTRHDGLSYMVIESLALGRQVIWSHNFLPFCHYVRSYDQVKKALLQIQMNPRPNIEGADYVRRNFSSKLMIGKLIKVYQGLCSRRYSKARD